MRVIDFHAHLDERWFETPLIGAGEFVAGMERCGVVGACVFTLMGFYGDCRAHNDALLERVGRVPTELYPFATVDPKLGMEAVRELARCLEMGKFKGVKFHPWLQAFAPSMVKGTMVELLKLAAGAGVPVLFHDGTPPYSTTFQIANVARWVPACNVVLGHAGLADYTLAAGELIRDLPNLYACVCGPKPADIKYLVEVGGAGKVIFGSDYGLSDWMIVEDRLDSVRFGGLSEEEKGLVLYGNAARLLRLGPKG